MNDTFWDIAQILAVLCFMFFIVFPILMRMHRFLEETALDWAVKRKQCQEQQQLALEERLVDIVLTSIPPYVSTYERTGTLVPIANFRRLVQDTCITLEITDTLVIVRGTTLPHKSVILEKSLFSFK